jgi:4-hydroxy-4-methyl-2-oxoglutarate aldolase
LRGTVKLAGGEVGATASVGDVDVHSGDWVVGDRDGVVVIASDRLDAVLDAGQERATKESAMFTRLRSGSTTVELLSLDTSSVRRPRADT